MSRKDKIATSISNAVVRPETRRQNQSVYRRWRAILKALLALYGVQLSQYAVDEFSRLRRRWQIDPGDYSASFKILDNENKPSLQTAGTMGYSGSTFFTTFDEKYLVKSVPRHFEHSFFKDDFLQPYAGYMTENIGSLLIRITDFLVVKDAYRHSLGVVLGLVPSHHIIMENLLVGRDEGQKKSLGILAQQQRSMLSSQPNQGEMGRESEEHWKWQTWDLKPTSYFFPERDIAHGRLTSEATKSRLADKFDEKLILTQSDANAFLNQLQKDTEVLETANAVDYSLFLVRIPVIESADTSQQPQNRTQNPFDSPDDTDTDTSQPKKPPSQGDTTAGPDVAPTAPTPSKPPFVPPGPPSWRTGIKSADGKYVYRAAILDFFWAKHKMHARAITSLVKSWNRIDPGGSKGPMSITTTSKEYRVRFLSMCEGFVERWEGGSVEE